MSAQLIEILKTGFTDSAGAPLAGGFAYVYQAGTTTAQTVYQDSDLSVAHTQPITLDALGRAEAYTNTAVRLVIEDSSNTQIEDIDDVTVDLSSFVTTDDVTYASEVILDDPGSADDTDQTNLDDYLQLIKDSLGGNDVKYLHPGTSAVARTIQSRLSEKYYSVKDFGAVGDDTNDDGPAIQLAMDAVVANGGGDLIFPPGTYSTNQVLSCLSSVRILGHGATINHDNNGICITLGGSASGSEKYNISVEGLKIVASTIGTGGQQALQFNHARNVYVRDCEFVDQGGVGVKFNNNCENYVVENCIADNIGVIGLYSEGETGVSANKYGWFINNRVLNFSYGIEVKEAVDQYIMGNHILTGRSSQDKFGILCTRNYSSTEFTPQRIHISNNIIKDADYQGINCTQTADFNISNNIVIASGNTGIVGSGSGGIISGNRIISCGAGLSANFGSDVSSGTNGVSSSLYAAANHQVFGNRVVAAQASLSYSFNQCDQSHIYHNVAEAQVYSGYAFQLSNCDGSVFESNEVKAGSHTYAYRYDSSNDNTLTVRNNRGAAGSVAIYSLPSDFTGHVIESDATVERHMARANTTDTTPTVIFSYTMPEYGNGSVVSFEATVVVKNSSGVTKAAIYKRSALYSRTGGTVTQEGTYDAWIDESRDANLDCAWGNTGNDVELTVTGVGTTNIVWNAEINIVKRPL